MTRVELLSQSYALTGISREALHDALRVMCPDALISRTGQPFSNGVNRKHLQLMLATWTPDNPTRHTCYFVSEMVYWYCAPHGSESMGVRIPGEPSLHRFIEWPDRTIVDLTCDQFPDTTEIPYHLSRGWCFLPPHTRSGGGGYVRGIAGPSARARRLADLLGFHQIAHKEAAPTLFGAV